MYKIFLILIIFIICGFNAASYERNYNSLDYYKTGDYELAYKYYHNDKNTKTILIFYGFCGSIDMMEAFMPYIRENYNILCIDYPGHGFSKDRSEFDLELFTSSAEGLLSYLKIGKVSLIGYSLGGIVALDYYKKYGNRVSELILWHTSANFNYSSSRKKFFKFIRDSLKKNYEFTLKKAAIPLLKDRYFDKKEISSAKDIVMFNDPSSVIDFFDKIISLNYNDMLGRINCPVLVIGSRIDILSPLKDTISMTKKIKNAVLIIENDSGHFSIVSKPEIMSEKLNAFLKLHTHQQ